MRLDLEVACDLWRLRSFLVVGRGRNPVVVGRNIGLDRTGLVELRSRREGAEAEESHWQTISDVFSNRARPDLLIARLTLRIASIVLAVLAALLAMLETTLLRRAVRICTLWWSIALRCIRILRGWWRISMLTVMLRRPLLVSLGVIRRILVVWV